MCDKDAGIQSSNDASDRIDEVLSDTIDRVISEKGECKLSVLLNKSNDWNLETLKDIECSSLSLKPDLLETIHGIKCGDGESRKTIFQLLDMKLSAVANDLPGKESLTDLLMSIHDFLERG